MLQIFHRLDSNNRNLYSEKTIHLWVHPFTSDRKYDYFWLSRGIDVNNYSVVLKNGQNESINKLFSEFNNVNWEIAREENFNKNGLGEYQSNYFDNRISTNTVAYSTLSSTISEDPLILETIGIITKYKSHDYYRIFAVKNSILGGRRFIVEIRTFCGIVMRRNHSFIKVLDHHKLDINKAIKAENLSNSVIKTYIDAIHSLTEDYSGDPVRN